MKERKNHCYYHDRRHNILKNYFSHYTFHSLAIIIISIHHLVTTAQLMWNYHDDNDGGWRTCLVLLLPLHHINQPPYLPHHFCLICLSPSFLLSIFSTETIATHQQAQLLIIPPHPISLSPWNFGEIPWMNEKNFKEPLHHRHHLQQKNHGSDPHYFYQSQTSSSHHLLSYCFTVFTSRILIVTMTRFSVQLQ